MSRSRRRRRMQNIPLQGARCWPVSPDLQVATSKPPTPARGMEPKGGSSPVSSSTEQRKRPRLAQGGSPNSRLVVRRLQTTACV